MQRRDLHHRLHDARGPARVAQLVDDALTLRYDVAQVEVVGVLRLNVDGAQLYRALILDRIQPATQSRENTCCVGSDRHLDDAIVRRDLVPTTDERESSGVCPESR